jgi:hypothetical protein
MGGTPFHTTANMMDKKQQTVSGNGSRQKKSPRQMNDTEIQEDHHQNDIRRHSGSNASGRIKIGAILMELWHFEGKRAHFMGDE